MLRLLRRVSFALTALILMTAAQAGMHLHGSGGTVTVLSLTDPTANKVFQRSAGATTGPLALSGTYSGGSLTGIQAQVTNASGGAVVLAWTTLSSPTIGGSTWSGTLAGVPQGGAYVVQVRAANATTVTATGTNNWFMGMVFMLYGQSNMDAFTSADGTLFGFPPPAAIAGTTFYDVPGNTWGAVPLANGIREFLNAVKTTTGIPCAAFNVAIGGAGSDFLSSDVSGGLDGTVYPAMTAGGITDIETLLWNQGESDANTAAPTLARTYDTNLELIHSRVAAHLGTRTMAQMPFVLSSLASFTASPGNVTDATWNRILSAQFFAPTTNTNTAFSHSNIDAPLGDGLHYTAQGQGENGKRFARTINSLLGFGGAPAHFEISGGTTVDATHTTVAVGLTGSATDITPSSGITGFQVTGDNGASYVTPSAAVRASATTLTLTHSSLSTTNARKFRYQYGMAPDISGLLRDNSSLALPLTYTTEPAEITPTSLSTVARPDYQGNAYDNTQTGATQTNAGIPIGPAASRRLAVIGLAGGTTGFASVTITPNVGTSSSGTNAATVITSGSQQTAIAYALLDANADTATTVTVSVTYSALPFAGTQMEVWTILSAQLVSTTPTTSNIQTTNSTTNSFNLVTPLHGLIIAIALTPNATRTISGTEVFAQRDTGTISVVAADATDTASNASSTITATSASSGTIAMAAAVWH